MIQNHRRNKLEGSALVKREKKKFQRKNFSFFFFFFVD